MVTSYYIMKMAKNKKYMSTDEYFNNVYNEPISMELRDSSQCRVCLMDGAKSILDDENKDDIIEALKIFANIEVSDDDVFPKHLCNNCYKFLNSAIMFRKIASKTNDTLKLYSNKINLTNTDDDWVEVYNDVNIEQQSPKIEKDLDPLVKLRKEELERSNRRVQCPTCKKIVRKSYYKIHKTMHDPNHHKYVCDICGKTFRLRVSHHNHRLRHRSDYPFKCQLCPFKGKYAERLKSHMRTHSNEYRYMCTECPARFLFKGNFNSHVLSKHKEPEHKCDNCDKAFHTTLKLKRHQEVDHMGIKNHVCNICGRAFGYRNAMMKHQRRVHKRERLRFVYKRSNTDNNNVT